MNSGERVAVTVARGDGIGPEIMGATLDILSAAGARLEIEEISVGKDVYLGGVSSGIEPSAWESLRRTKILLKAPITTPQGGGYKSLNVTIRKSLGLFANIRPCPTYAPFVHTAHPTMDIVIVRENDEDLYGGIEHRQTSDVVQCLKLISRPGTERIVRYGFEYARRHNRQKVSCFTKDNIMKMTDGLFHRVFSEVAAEYPELEAEHLILDIGTARLATAPEQFDVLILSNLYGDVLSDVAAELTGSVGLGASANIGDEVAMFEAIHGSAPDIAGKDIANPSGLLLAAVQMLAHIGQGDVAASVHNAWLKTIEDGIHTADLYDPERSLERVGTSEFAKAVIDRLGESPQVLSPVEYLPDVSPIKVSVPIVARPEKAQVGIDVFVDWEGTPDELGHKLEACAGQDTKLVMVTNRGQKVYPGGIPETFCVDHWCCRFQAPREGDLLSASVCLGLMARLVAAGLPFIKSEGLFTFDGVPGFSLGQGQ